MNNDVVSIPPNYPTSTTTPDPLTHTKQRKALVFDTQHRAQPVKFGGNLGVMHGDDATAIGVVDLLGGERIAGVTGITVKAGATVQVIDRNPDKAAAAAAEGVTNQTPWTSGFKVVK